MQPMLAPTLDFPVIRRPRVPTVALRVLRRVRARLSDPAGAAEFEVVGLLLAFAIWLMQPGWIDRQYPGVAADLRTIAPLWAWVLATFALAITTAIASVFERGSILAWAFIGIFGFWLVIGWYFCVRPSGPPLIGVMAPVFATFALIHCLQIPDGKGGSGGAGK